MDMATWFDQFKNDLAAHRATCDGADCEWYGCRTVQALVDLVAARERQVVAELQVQIDRADGALADASTVQTGDLERGIRQLANERDGLDSAYRENITLRADAQRLTAEVAQLSEALSAFAENLRLMRQYNRLSQDNQNSCIVDGYALWGTYGHLLKPWPPPRQEGDDHG